MPTTDTILSMLRKHSPLVDKTVFPLDLQSYSDQLFQPQSLTEWQYIVDAQDETTYKLLERSRGYAREKGLVAMLLQYYMDKPVLSLLCPPEMFVWNLGYIKIVGQEGIEPGYFSPRCPVVRTASLQMHNKMLYASYGVSVLKTICRNISRSDFGPECSVYTQTVELCKLLYSLNHHLISMPWENANASIQEWPWLLQPGVAEQMKHLAVGLYYTCMIFKSESLDVLGGFSWLAARALEAVFFETTCPTTLYPMVRVLKQWIDECIVLPLYNMCFKRLTQANAELSEPFLHITREECLRICSYIIQRGKKDARIIKTIPQTNIRAVLEILTMFPDIVLMNDEEFRTNVMSVFQLSPNNVFAVSRAWDTEKIISCDTAVVQQLTKFNIRENAKKYTSTSAAAAATPKGEVSKLPKEPSEKSIKSHIQYFNES